MTRKPSYRWLVSRETLERANRYLDALQTGRQSPGRYLARVLDRRGGWPDSPEALLGALLQTKKPCIFAESAVAGDGSDWTVEEISLLGDIACQVPVTVFDDGRWQRPEIHRPPFPAQLLFVPGALLQDLRQAPSPDRVEVAPDVRLDPDAYERLYRRRLLPVFDAIEAAAAEEGVLTVVTIPGLGCGQFAGAFTGVKALLAETLRRILERHAGRWPHLRLVHFDPFDGVAPESRQIAPGLHYRVWPLTSTQGIPQLSRVTEFDAGDGHLENARLFSLVAWDHVSWPGNDFYAGSRNTDDGVKAAATDSMYRMTGIEGRYDPHLCQYRPPTGFRNWYDVVQAQGIRLQTHDNLSVF